MAEARSRPATALVVAAVAAAGWTAAVLAAGRIDLRPVGVPLLARTPWPSALCGAALALAALAWRRGRVVDDVANAGRLVARHAALLAVLVAAGTGIVAVVFGTFAAGGSDSYCYVEQAERWAAGTIDAPVTVPFVPDWPNASLSLTPTGFVPSRRVEGAIAPICPAGLALAMAVPRVLGAPRVSVFYVVPLLAALAVLASFLVGRRLAGPLGGLLTMGLTATAPVFLYQSVQPMSDVPATAWWLLALALAGTRTRAGLLFTGLAAGLAILMRPNLAPLSGLLVLYAWLRAGEERGGWDAVRRAGAVLVGLVPAAVAVGVVQQVLYGSPLRSGYGSLDVLFKVSHVWTNLARYPRWLLETQSPVVLLAVAAPLLAVARTRGAGRRDPCALYAWLLLAFAAGAFVAYLPYVPFDGWWFLRFWLPGIPPLTALSMATLVWGLAAPVGTTLADARADGGGTPSGPRPVRVLAGVGLVVGLAALSAWQVRGAADRSAFALKAMERKFVAMGEYVDRVLPPEAVVLTVWHSGGARYYGRRGVVVWDAFPAASFDAVVASLERQGARPYLLLETWEQDRFRARLAGASPYAALDWPPRAQYGVEVRLWSLGDRARFLRGEPTPTDRLW